MATKKQASKPARGKGGKAVKPAKPVKSAKPAAKSPAKKAAPKKAAARPVAKKAAPKKAAPKPAAKKPVAKKPAPKPVAKKAAVKAKPAPVKKQVKPVVKPAPKKADPPKKEVKKDVPVVKKVVEVAKKAVKAVKEAVVKKPAPIKTIPVKAGKPPIKASQLLKKPTPAPVQKEKSNPIPFKPIVQKPQPKPSRPVVVPKTSTNKSVKYEPEFTKSVLDLRQQGQSGPTMRYSDAELNEFRDLINKKLEVAKKELAYLQGLITRKDESGDLDEGRYMTMEDGSMSMEREQLSQMASRQIQFIDHLEKAIMRIENKTYGICRVTGQLIDKARLRAVPHATLSIEAKQMMNK